MNIKKNSGVTIISIIVVIVVLIILAMIPFGMLTSENNLIKKIIQAKDMDSAEETREKVAVEALGSFDRRTGKLSSEKLKNNLKEHLGIEEADVQENEKGGYDFSLGEYDVEVKSDAGVNVLPKKEIQQPPFLKNGDIRFIFDPSKLTNKDVQVTIQSRGDINTVRLTLQYATVDPDNEESWQTYLEPIVFQNNGPIYARIINENGEKSNYVTDNVTNIDKQPPVITEFKAIEDSITTNSLNVTVTATDDRQLATKNPYKFFVKEENGEYKLSGTSSKGEYTYKGLKQGESYTIKVIVTDEAGNTQESETQITTDTIPDLNTGEEPAPSASPTEPKKGNITFKYSCTEWNNFKDVDVTLELSQDIEAILEAKGLKLQYQTANELNKEWQDYKEPGFKITKNGSIYARLIEIEGNQVSNSASSTYTKFDRKAPTITIELEEPTAGKVKVNVTSCIDEPSSIKADDASGLVDKNRYTYYLKEVNGTEEFALYSGNDESYTYEGLKQGKRYKVRVTVKDKAGNIGEATSIVTTKGIPDINVEGSIEVTYNPENWTNSNVRVNVTSKYTEEGYTLQYAKTPDNDDVIVWNDVPVDGFDMEKNGKFKIRLKYQSSLEGTPQYSEPIEKEVNWIDKVKPNINILEDEEITTNSIKININAGDTLSGIDEAEGSTPYKYYIFEGEITDTAEIESKLSNEEPLYKTNEKEYTFTDLSQNTMYTIVVTAQDRVSNINYVTKLLRTDEVPGLNEGGLEQAGNITFTYSKTVWNNDENVTVTLQLSEELKSQVLVTQGGTATSANLTLQYSLDGEIWQDYQAEGFLISQNGSVHAKLVDSSNQTGGTATSNYNMFDRTPPTVDEISNDDFETTSTSIKVTVHATDGESGIKEYKYYLDGETEEDLKTSQNANFENPNTDNFTFDNLEKYSTHTIVVKVIDNATNVSKVEKKIVKGSELKEGDYVNYIPDSEYEDYISEGEHNGFQDQTLKRKTLKWRVLSIDKETGETKLISDAFGTEGSETITYKGTNGYNNAVKDLNDLCKTLYGHTYSIVRCLNLDEFTNKAFSSTESGSLSAQSPSIWNSEIGGGGTLGQNDQDTWYDGTGEMTKYTNNAYECELDSAGLLYNSNCWVAGRSLNVTDSNYQFGIHDADTDLSYQTLFDGIDGTESTVSKAIRAIAIISGSIQFKSNGDPSTPEGGWDIAWNNEIDEGRFYFDATTESDTVTFERTDDESDYEDILTTSTNLDLGIHNNNGTDYNASYPTTYQITMLDNPKFELAEGDTITRTIEGGEKKNEIITLNMKIKDLENTQDSVKIRVASLEPYSKTVELNLKVDQKGAIQTIEDLVDLSLVSRGRSNKYTQDEAISGRFKMTRDLDFESTDSYENSSRTDYSDVNLDGHTDTLINEMTQNAGFLPIADNSSNIRFKGAFNGNGHSLNNLLIHNTENNSVGIFEAAENATIKNMIVYGNIDTTISANMGAVTGRMWGNLTVENFENHVKITGISNNGSVGGIIGSISENSSEVTLKNIKNYNDISNGNQAAGLVAWLTGTVSIENCHNYGNIVLNSDDGMRVGGLIASTTTDDNINLTIQESSNSGNISNNHNSGGLIGLINNASINVTIVNCYNTGNIIGKNTGGLIGYSGNNGYTYIYNSNNTGSVSSDSDGHASGIIGSSTDREEHITMRNIYNAGTLSGKYHNGIMYMVSSNPNVSVEYAYHLNDNPATNTDYKFGTAMSASKMRQEAFVSTLNDYVNDNQNVTINGKQFRLCSWEMNVNDYPSLNFSN